MLTQSAVDLFCAFAFPLRLSSCFDRPQHGKFGTGERCIKIQTFVPHNILFHFALVLGVLFLLESFTYAQ